MSVRSFVVLALPFVASVTVAEAQAQRVFDGAPAASWIAPPGAPGDSFTVFHARRTIDLPSMPARFVVHISADNRYRLYVNGVQVSSGPQRSDVTHWRYETVDLAPQLHAGRNVIAALVWNWGAARPVAQHSYRTGFLLQGNGVTEAELVNSGPGWKLLRDAAYAPIVITNATVGGYFAAAPGDSVDGVRYPWGWERADYVDDTWLDVAPPNGSRAAAPLSAFGVAGGSAIVGRVKRRAMPPGGTGEVLGWQLEARSIPPMEETLQRLTRVRRATGIAANDAFLRGAGDLVIPARTTATLLLDQSHTTNAYAVLETSGGAGSMVRLTYAEALIDAGGQKGNRDEIEGRTVRGVRDVFLPDGGARRRFQTLYWRSFRYIQMDVTTSDEPLRVHDLHGIFTAYPFVERATFSSDQPWLADMWRMNWNGARIGAFETYMDTPYYEQLQYVGDTRVQALISLYVAGDDRLVRQAIEHFDVSRIPEGITASRYPSALTQLIPPFSLIYVAMVHDYFMHRDDAAFVSQRLAGVRGILDWYARYVDSTGQLGAMPYWNYVDWTRPWRGGVPPGADDGHSTTITLLYAYALLRAAELEDGVGARGSGAAYRARAALLLAAARAQSWDAARGLFSRRAGHQRVQPADERARGARRRRAASGATPVDGARPCRHHAHAGVVLLQLLCARGAAEGGPWRPLHRAARALAGDAATRPDVNAGESGAHALRHTRVGRAPELRTACHGARRAAGESRLPHGAYCAGIGAAPARGGARAASVGRRRRAVDARGRARAAR